MSIRRTAAALAPDRHVPARRVPVIRPFIPWMLLLAATGCVARAPEIAPPDRAEARERLESALSAWRSGETASRFMERVPNVRVRDQEWLGGTRLIEFEIRTDPQRNGDAWNFHVRLATETPARRVTAEVTYLVSAGPPLTILRE